MENILCVQVIVLIEPVGQRILLFAYPMTKAINPFKIRLVCRINIAYLTP